MQQWRVAECLGQIGGGRALEDLARQAIDSASAVGLITVAGTGREDYFRGGRAVQRLWLTAASVGLALQPMTGLPYLLARLERGGGVGLRPCDQVELRAIRSARDALFAADPGRADVFLFRVHHGGPPTARSLRRPLDAVLSFR
jgi:hypothetical protein